MRDLTNSSNGESSSATGSASRSASRSVSSINGKSSRNRLLPLDIPFFIGVNYWASHAGTAMWSDWRPKIVDHDLQRLADAGVDVIRAFPLWPDFQPIDQLFTGRGKRKDIRMGEQRLADTPEGQAGMSPVMMERFGAFLDIAQRHGIKVIVGLITGWMSGRLFVPNALKGRAILTDPEAILWQVRFVRYFIGEMKEHPSIVAWDLGNECNEMGEVGSREEAWVWTAALANAIKRADSARPLVSGMHSLTPAGKWTMQDQGELTDILTTHPYPFWTPYLDYDPINTLRPIVHATAESLFYGQIGGKPCFAEEMGTMGPMVCGEEVAAQFARASMFTQWAHGLDGLLWWCANDQTRLQHAPYDWVACEGELGLVTEEGRIKPALQELHRIKQVIAKLPDGPLPPRRTEAVCIVNSAQDHWAVAIGAFMLAKQAGFDLDYVYEDQLLPDAPLYLLPSMSGVLGMPKPRWEQLLAKVQAGATLYISLDDGYLLNFKEATGLKVINRRRRAGQTEVALDAAAFGGASASHTAAMSETVTLPLNGSFQLTYEPIHAEVLGQETDGNPALTRAHYGKGKVYVFGFPLELELTRRPETAYRPDELPYWRVYELVAQQVLEDRVLRTGNPHVGATEHSHRSRPGRLGQEGNGEEDAEAVASGTVATGAAVTAVTVVMINYSPEPQRVVPQIKAGWRVASCYYGGADSWGASGTVSRDVSALSGQTDHAIASRAVNGTASPAGGGVAGGAAAEGAAEWTLPPNEALIVQVTRE